MPHPSLNHPCAVCKRATSLWCSRCQNAWSCSPDHMGSDWPQHRNHCHSASAQYGSSMIATPPPAEPEYISVSAILFLAEEDRPEIITVRCRPPQHGVCPIPMLQTYFDSPPDNVVITQGLNSEPLRFPLHAFYSPTALSKASPISRSIYHITSGAASKPFFGNVVALKYKGARRQRYTDASFNDLPALSAYFLSCQ
ncbi:Hif prolyl hydroxylase [Favolaschia claudopus]|uniref:Hif prolyl hydroxylase n=1 Tax=Favolaschia claudopus TaxID=2862362 RepID=A0AAV9ZYK9_9AGAR